MGVAVDGSGNVYVADTNNDAVKEILAAGGYTTVKTLYSAWLLDPSSVAVDASGNLYVANNHNSEMDEFWRRADTPRPKPWAMVLMAQWRGGGRRRQRLRRR